MEAIAVDKFWILEWFETVLLNAGIGSALTNLFTFIVACGILTLLIWIVDLIGSRIVMTIIHASVRKTETKWDDFLLERRFFSRLMRLVPLFLVAIFIKDIFAGYETWIIHVAKIIINSSITLMITMVVCSFLNAANDVYESNVPERTIKGYIQTAKIILYIIAVIVIMMMIFDKTPQDLFVGLGASAAIMTLVFKDTILGFVASIQLSAQDMVRKGDWIEIPTKNTDGVVTDINLNSVKVRNWNNTLTMVPIYSLVSEPFTNWRNMEESDGRRFKRPLIIDINSVKQLTDQEVEDIYNNQYIQPYSANMRNMSKVSNHNLYMTNIGLYRSYITSYLLDHPNINNNLPLLVRYTTITDNGITLELYAFTTKKDLLDYENIFAEVFENVVTAAPTFGVKFYQHPSGNDIDSLRSVLRS